MAHEDLESDDTPTKIEPIAFDNLKDEMKMSDKHSILDSQINMSQKEDGSQSEIEDSMNRSSNQKSVTQGQNDEEARENENKLNLNFMIDEQLVNESLPSCVIHP